MRKPWSTPHGGKAQASSRLEQQRRVEEVERRLAELKAGQPLFQDKDGPRQTSAAQAPDRPIEPPTHSLDPRRSLRVPVAEHLIPPAEEALKIELPSTKAETALVLTEESPAAFSARPGQPSQPPVRLRRLRIGEVLLERKLITQEQLDQALAEQRRTGERIGTVLVSLGFISVQDMVSALAQQLGVEVIMQDEVQIDPSAKDVLPLDIIKRHEVVPLWANDKVLRIAMADPTNLAIIDEIRFRSGRWVQVVLAAEATVRSLIASAFSTDSLMSEILTESSADFDIEQIQVEKGEDKEATNVYELMQESTGRPVVNFVNFLLTDSVRRRASDVHVEPYEHSLRIRFRIDGELQNIVSPPLRLHVPVVSRIKVMAGMDISKRRIPQDGHLAVRYHGQVLHYRVSTLPTVYGEKAVLRLLTKEADLADLSKIGMPPEEEQRLRRAIAQPQGLVLVTGPTGSGKTTTVHAALNAISKPTINVATLEDPVEVTLPGINHVQINEASGLSFADGLRSLLRQDPDVVFVGEMRDAEVSTIAIRASLTGHLVLSTLHTNSALECFDRLDDMGVERYLVSATIQTVVAQRLLRRICTKCSEPIAMDEIKDIADLDAIRRRMAELGLPETLRRGKGCDDCMNSGYKRRIGVYEVLPMDRQIRELLRRKVPPEELDAAVGERGFRTLFENGLRLCSEGLTSLHEVLRVLSPSD